MFLGSALLLATLALPPSPVVTDLGAPAGPGAGEPFLFAEHDGLLLSWLEPVAGTNQTALRFAVLRAGRCSSPRTIVQRGDLVVNWADFPSVVEDRRGTLFAHWLQTSGASTFASDVRLAISKDGGATWSAPMLLNRDGKKAEHGFVTLVPLANDGVGAAWLDGRNMVEGKEEGDMSLRYAILDPSGNLRSDVQLDARTCECCWTGMALSGGHPVIVYRDRTAEEVRDIAVVRETRNGWSKPAPVHADGWKLTGCPVNGPQADARGSRVAVAWFTGASNQAHAYLAFSDDAGTTLGKPIVIDDGKPLGRVDVVMLDANTAAVTWSEQTPGGVELRARRVTRDGKSGPPVKVADNVRSTGVARAAAIGSDVYIAWTEQSAGSKRVHVSRVRW